MTKKTTQHNSTQTESVLYVAIELSGGKWKLAFTTGPAQKARLRTMEAGDLDRFKSEVHRAKERFGLPEQCPVECCFEAGRDGFWPHRFLTQVGIENVVVDSSSIEVNRRARRPKADRLDADSLVRIRMRYSGGDHKVWRVVNVPSEEDEDNRQLHRELASLQEEVTRACNRIRGLLATQGIRFKRGVNLSGKRMESLRKWDGKPLLPGLQERIRRQWAHVEFLKGQIGELRRQRRAALRAKSQPESTPDLAKIRQLLSLRAVGEVTAWLLVAEFFGWRQFKNRRQVGSLAGLTPTPYQSGDKNFEQGISKAGIVPVRKVAIELAWGWLRYQPKSELSLWYERRFAYGGKKARKVGIVALARKLLIELWRYLETGVLPKGAELKKAVVGKAA
jgi:transposase